jgi:hypothetical protein
MYILMTSVKDINIKTMLQYIQFTDEITREYEGGCNKHKHNKNVDAGFVTIMQGVTQKLQTLVCLSLNAY